MRKSTPIRLGLPLTSAHRTHSPLIGTGAVPGPGVVPGSAGAVRLPPPAVLGTARGTTPAPPLSRGPRAPALFQSPALCQGPWALSGSPPRPYLVPPVVPHRPRRCPGARGHRRCSRARRCARVRGRCPAPPPGPTWYRPWYHTGPAAVPGPAGTGAVPEPGVVPGSVGAVRLPPPALLGTARGTTPAPPLSRGPRAPALFQSPALCQGPWALSGSPPRPYLVPPVVPHRPRRCPGARGHRRCSRARRCARVRGRCPAPPPGPTWYRPWYHTGPAAVPGPAGTGAVPEPGVVPGSVGAVRLPPPALLGTARGTTPAPPLSRGPRAPALFQSPALCQGPWALSGSPPRPYLVPPVVPHRPRRCPGARGHRRCSRARRCARVRGRCPAPPPGPTWYRPWYHTGPAAVPGPAGTGAVPEPGVVPGSVGAVRLPPPALLGTARGTTPAPPLSRGPRAPALFQSPALCQGPWALSGSPPRPYLVPPVVPHRPRRCPGARGHRRCSRARRCARVRGRCPAPPPGPTWYRPWYHTGPAAVPGPAGTGAVPEPGVVPGSVGAVRLPPPALLGTARGTTPAPPLSRGPRAPALFQSPALCQGPWALSGSPPRPYLVPPVVPHRPRRCPGARGHRRCSRARRCARVRGRCPAPPPGPTWYRPWYHTGPAAVPGPAGTGAVPEPGVVPGSVGAVRLPPPALLGTARGTTPAPPLSRGPRAPALFQSPALCQGPWALSGSPPRPYLVPPVVPHRPRRCPGARGHRRCSRARRCARVRGRCPAPPPGPTWYRPWYHTGPAAVPGPAGTGAVPEPGVVPGSVGAVRLPPPALLGTARGTTPAPPLSRGPRAPALFQSPALCQGPWALSGSPPRPYLVPPVVPHRPRRCPGARGHRRCSRARRCARVRGRCPAPPPGPTWYRPWYHTGPAAVPGPAGTGAVPEPGVVPGSVGAVRLPPPALLGTARGTTPAPPLSRGPRAPALFQSPALCQGPWALSGSPPRPYLVPPVVPHRPRRCPGARGHRRCSRARRCARVRGRCPAPPPGPTWYRPWYHTGPAAVPGPAGTGAVPEPGVVPGSVGAVRLPPPALLGTARGTTPAPPLSRGPRAPALFQSPALCQGPWALSGSPPRPYLVPPVVPHRPRRCPGARGHRRCSRARRCARVRGRCPAPPPGPTWYRPWYHTGPAAVPGPAGTGAVPEPGVVPGSVGAVRLPPPALLGTARGTTPAPPLSRGPRAPALFQSPALCQGPWALSGSPPRPYLVPPVVPHRPRRCPGARGHRRCSRARRCARVRGRCPAPPPGPTWYRPWYHTGPAAVPGPAGTGAVPEPGVVPGSVGAVRLPPPALLGTARGTTPAPPLSRGPRAPALFQSPALCQGPWALSGSPPRPYLVPPVVPHRPRRCPGARGHRRCSRARRCARVRGRCPAPPPGPTWYRPWYHTGPAAVPGPAGTGAVPEPGVVPGSVGAVRLPPPALLGTARGTTPAPPLSRGPRAPALFQSPALCQGPWALSGSPPRPYLVPPVVPHRPRRCPGARGHRRCSRARRCARVRGRCPAPPPGPTWYRPWYHTGPAAVPGPAGTGAVPEPGVVPGSVGAVRLPPPALLGTARGTTPAPPLSRGPRAPALFQSPALCQGPWALSGSPPRPYLVPPVVPHRPRRCPGARGHRRCSRARRCARVRGRCPAPPPGPTWYRPWYHTGPAAVPGPAGTGAVPEPGVVPGSVGAVRLPPPALLGTARGTTPAPPLSRGPRAPALSRGPPLP
ncbi:collagen alpha-1(I) chain-like [Passer montanus]|uniref:collagen alpha-1(I) chain-like n=1 Tax=Passer montanus TaxID=9160 RepID=UPI00195FAC29|nr:collagen alpha-1(I) chain-like [Passer montanus]